MKRKDLLWCFLYPVYQIIGTIRHEGSHALAAMAEGAEVTKFVFWPNVALGHFTWGYVSWQGYPPWFVTAAPYFCDLVTFFIALFIILEAKPKRRWVWINILIIGMLSPFVNSLNAYVAGLTRRVGDVAELLVDLNLLPCTCVSLSRQRSTLGDYTTAVFARKRGIQDSTYPLLDV